MRYMDTNNNTGPHDVMSTYIKKLTRCGNPDLLDLSKYGLVEYVEPTPEPYIPTIQDQMATLEASITRRMNREALLGSTLVDVRTGKTASEEIANVDAQIAALRAQL